MVSFTVFHSEIDITGGRDRMKHFEWLAKLGKVGSRGHSPPVTEQNSYKRNNKFYTIKRSIKRRSIPLNCYIRLPADWWWERRFKYRPVESTLNGVPTVRKQKCEFQSTMFPTQHFKTNIVVLLRFPGTFICDKESKCQNLWLKFYFKEFCRFDFAVLSQRCTAIHYVILVEKLNSELIK